MKWMRSMLARLLQAGPVPRHLAFVMDGNRRFADRLAAPSVAVGHERGFEKLLEALEWCLELGVGCVSVYAFSIDNFRRSPEEVATLMRLAETKLTELAEQQELVQRYGVRVRVVGDLALLPPGVQAAAAHVMAATESHDRAVLNICMAYASSQELAHALDALQQEGSCAGSSLQREDLERHLYTQGCPPVDLLVRTSGEERLSDFLLWQSAGALLHFAPVLWPDFSFPDLLRAVAAFQRAAPHLTALRGRAAEAADSAAPAAEPAGAAGPGGQAAAAREARPETAAAAGPAAAAAAESAGAGAARGAQPQAASPEPGAKAGGSGPPSPRTPLPAPGAGASAASSSPDGSQQGLEERPPAAAAAAAAAPVRRRWRKRALAGLPPEGTDLFAPQQQPAGEDPAARAAALRAAGIAGYDSMEDEDDWEGHISSCPCCLVRRLPLHAACTDPTPAIAAMRRADPPQ